MCDIIVKYFIAGNIDKQNQKLVEIQLSNDFKTHTAVSKIKWKNKLLN